MERNVRGRLSLMGVTLEVQLKPLEGNEGRKGEQNKERVQAQTEQL